MLKIFEDPSVLSEDGMRALVRGAMAEGIAEAMTEGAEVLNRVAGSLKSPEAYEEAYEKVQKASELLKEAHEALK